MPEGSLVGQPVLRVEDLPHLTGSAIFTDDVAAEGALHAVFVRSAVVHARIQAVHTDEARAMPDVVGVFTAEDLQLPALSAGLAPPEFDRPVLAAGVVRFVGEAVAVVVARTWAAAIDAAEVVVIDVEPLPAVVDPSHAETAEAPILFPAAGTNVAMVSPFGSADSASTDSADVTVRARFVNQRLAPVPLEPNAALAVPDPESGGLTVWVSTQAPHDVRSRIADPIGLPEDRVRVIAPCVGGAFGAKSEAYPELVVVCALALRLSAPVRYRESRSENFLTMTHGRAQVQDVAITGTSDGHITGLHADLLGDGGAYPGAAVYLPVLTQRMLSGPYRIPSIAGRVACVCTNATPVGPYRGAGRPEAAALVERAVDMLAAETGLDPAELRRRNLIPDSAFPYTTAVGTTYDTGDYERVFDTALRAADYAQLRREQTERRARGGPQHLGIGISCYVEATGFGVGSEFGSVEVLPDGSILVLSGTSPHGQGAATVFAQIVADAMRVPHESVTVVHSDTGVVRSGGGTMASRSAQVGGSAVLRASEAVLEKARRLAAHLLESDPHDIHLLDDGRIGVAGAPDRSFSWAELARSAGRDANLPEGMEPGLAEAADFSQPYDGTYAFGAHVVVVEVDAETGLVVIRQHVAVDDAGRILNPLLADGQVHGGAAQGVAQALFEEVRYDDDGTPLTASLTGYGVPTAADLCRVDRIVLETPTPNNPLGAKGIGEAATIGSTPAVHNAVVDAVAHLGIRHLDMPLTPERVWRAIRAATDPAASVGWP